MPQFQHLLESNLWKCTAKWEQTNIREKIKPHFLREGKMRHESSNTRKCNMNIQFTSEILQHERRNAYQKSFFSEKIFRNFFSLAQFCILMFTFVDSILCYNWYSRFLSWVRLQRMLTILVRHIWWNLTLTFHLILGCLNKELICMGKGLKL